jgi:PAS domain S-box-containing protein
MKTDPAKAQIVVVNDDATQLMLWNQLLRIGGFSVHPFSSATAALEAIKTQIKPALIVTDLHMPGLDGWRFCRLLRSPDYPAFNRTPVLVISATFAGEDARQITAELGANAFLSSPFLPSELLGTAEQLLAGKTPVLTTRVLIVEDEDVVSTMLVRSFAAHGYTAAAVRTASEALHRCRRESQELIILDYHLPDMPGDVLLDEVVRTSPHSAVIMMTGDPRAELALDWMRRGARAYVHKPFNPEYLIALGEKARREIAMLHIETRLEERTRDLREKEERYRTLFENVTDALFVYALQLDGSLGRCLEVNDVACRLLGYPREELLHRPPLDFFVARDAAETALLTGQLLDGTALEFERQLTAKDGRSIPVEIHARMFNIDGRVAVIALVRDCTERHQAEADRRRLAEQAHQMQKLESLGVVAGGIAHDFNNILLTILGNVELALNELAPLSPARVCLLEVDKAARRAAELSMNMLIYSGRASFTPQPLTLGAVAAEMSVMLTSGMPRDIKLRLESDTQPPTIEADITLVRQVVTNLVNNAAEAIGGRAGEIVLRTGEMVCDAAYLATTWLAEALPPGCYAYLEVSDNGSGMDSATLARIFDPFFTTHFTGRGLGLAAVLGSVRLHRGAIRVVSAPGQGTTFRVLLPVAPPAAAAATPAPAEAVWRGQGTVLLVDDEAAVRDLGQRMLEKIGFSALVAADGPAAAAQLQAHRDEIALVILDLTMPNMDGGDVFNALQKIKPGVPILMCSGFDEQSVTGTVTGPGYAGFLQKPYQQAALLAKLRNVLEAFAKNGKT